MRLRDFKKEDSAVIAGWLKSEDELYKWSADIYNKFPLGENDIYDNYQSPLATKRFFPLSMEDDDGSLAGHFIIRYPSEDDSTVRFGFVIVKPELRGRGYGKEMLELGKEYVRENLSARRIDLGVFSNNPSASRCYEAVGFKEFERSDCTINSQPWVRIGMELFL